jgi:hypothetical protein
VAGIGVTAWTEDDARAMLMQTWPGFAGRLSRWQSWTLENLSTAQIIPDVDIRLLDQGHVIPNMGLVVDRGVWWPKLR